MSFLSTMEQRYTTKKYDASKSLSDDQLDALKNIVQLSPSSINSQPWKFTFVRSKAVKEQLSTVSWLNTPKIIDCDTVVVFSRIDDIALFEQQIEAELPQGAVDYYKEFIQPQSEAEIKAWFGRQLYLALGIFLSACAEMGIDATPMEGIEPEQYDRILGLENHASMAAVAIGYRDPEDFNQPSKKPKTRRALDKVVQSI